MATDASNRGWGPGWPVDRRKDMARVTMGDVSVWVHHLIAPIVAHLMAECEDKGYQLRTGECWGYCNRAISGTSKASNHSWGLAVDLNAPANPMGSNLVTDMPEWMPPLWEAKSFRWGGSYTQKKDAMHYEFMESPAVAARIVAELGRPIPDSRQKHASQEGGDHVVVNRKNVCLLPHPEGYWEITEDGGVFSFGQAGFHGSLGNQSLNSPIIGGDVTPEADGYWLVAGDGGVFCFGKAGFFGSLGSTPLNAPVIGLRATRTGQGYWLTAADGGVFAFGDARYEGRVDFPG